MVSEMDFHRTVYGYWAERFMCPIDEFAREGCRLVVDGELSGKDRLIVYHVNIARVIRLSPELASSIGIESETTTDVQFSSVDGLGKLFGYAYRFEVESTLLDHFLHSTDFIPYGVPDGFTVKAIDADRDEQLLSEFFGACTAEELDAADIILNEPDPVIRGLIYEGAMVAYSSHRYWANDTIADMGVLVHPDFRARGLGKAIVSELCQWCISHDVIPMYRVFSDHETSCRIPTALGFGELIPIESVSVAAL